MRQKLVIASIFFSLSIATIWLLDSRVNLRVAVEQSALNFINSDSNCDQLVGFVIDLLSNYSPNSSGDTFMVVDGQIKGRDLHLSRESWELVEQLTSVFKRDGFTVEIEKNSDVWVVWLKFNRIGYVCRNSVVPDPYLDFFKFEWVYRRGYSLAAFDMRNELSPLGSN